MSAEASAAAAAATEAALAEVERFAAVGDGEDLRLKSDGLAGGALALDEQVLHLCAFKLTSHSGVRGRRHGSSLARASTRRATRH